MPYPAHQDKKNYKKQQEESLKNVAAPTPAPAAEPLPEKTKERKAYPHMEREKRDWKQKELTSGHTHDRRSGTGREDRPRKAGGGYGNVGNVKDEQNADKYVKETAEEAKPEETKVEAEVPAVEVKPASPQKLTLDEYYKSKGVDVAFNVAAKGPAKRGEINADWLKKEKLQVLQTKEDKRQQEKGNTEQTVKFSTTKVGLDLDEDKLNIVGFGSKAAPKHHEHKHGEKHEHKHYDNKGKKGKLQFSADDFPAL